MSVSEVPLGYALRRDLREDRIVSLRPVLHAGVDGQPAGGVEAFFVVFVQHAVATPQLHPEGQRLGQFHR